MVRTTGMGRGDSGLQIEEECEKCEQGEERGKRFGMSRGIHFGANACSMFKACY
jgi:hypothetical protein